MADEFVNTVPKIVITEATPSIRVNSAAETSSIISSGENPKQATEESKDAIGEEVSMKKPAETILEVDARAKAPPSERERSEEDDFRHVAEENCFERILGVLASFNENNLFLCPRALASFNESKYMLIIQFLLLALPISAGFMGAKYLDKCPLSSETPVFLFLMGVAGTIVIICRIMLIAQKMMLPSQREWQVLRVVVIAGNMAIIVCLATEMFSFFRVSPSFEMGSSHYCNPLFYKYTYWTNWTCLIVITFLMLLSVAEMWYSPCGE